MYKNLQSFFNNKNINLNIDTTELFQGFFKSVCSIENKSGVIFNKTAYGLTKETAEDTAVNEILSKIFKINYTELKKTLPYFNKKDTTQDFSCCHLTLHELKKQESNFNVQLIANFTKDVLNDELEIFAYKYKNVLTNKEEKVGIGLTNTEFFDLNHVVKVGKNETQTRIAAMNSLYIKKAIANIIFKRSDNAILSNELFSRFNSFKVLDTYINKEPNRFHFVIKDVSNNGLVPVLSIVLFDKKNNFYHVGFGASHNLEKALDMAVVDIIRKSIIQQRITYKNYVINSYNDIEDCGLVIKNFNIISFGNDGYYPDSFIYGNNSPNKSLPKETYSTDETEAQNKYNELINSENLTLYERHIYEDQHLYVASYFIDEFIHINNIHLSDSKQKDYNDTFYKFLNSIKDSNYNYNILNSCKAFLTRETVAYLDTFTFKYLFPWMEPELRNNIKLVLLQLLNCELEEVNSQQALCDFSALIFNTSKDEELIKTLVLLNNFSLASSSGLSREVINKNLISIASEEEIKELNKLTHSPSILFEYLFDKIFLGEKKEIYERIITN